MTLQRKITHRGVEQLVARQAHNLEVACSSPASATKQASDNKYCRMFLFYNDTYGYDEEPHSGLQKIIGNIHTTSKF